MKRSVLLIAVVWTIISCSDFTNQREKGARSTTAPIKVEAPECTNPFDGARGRIIPVIPKRFQFTKHGSGQVLRIDSLTGKVCDAFSLAISAQKTARVTLLYQQVQVPNCADVDVRRRGIMPVIQDRYQFIDFRGRFLRLDTVTAQVCEQRQSEGIR